MTTIKNQNPFRRVFGTPDDLLRHLREPASGGATSCAKTRSTRGAWVVIVMALRSEVARFSDPANQNDSCTRCVVPESGLFVKQVLRSFLRLFGMTRYIRCPPKPAASF
jgi:hypothetical protein